MSDVHNSRRVHPRTDLMTPDRRTTTAHERTAVLAKCGAAHGGGRRKQKLFIKDSTAALTLQQVLTRPQEFDVLATLNLIGDYISHALAAQVGGIGIAPGGNINYVTGHAI